MYTGNYECLELFVKPDEGKKGSVLLKNVKESTTETKEPKHIYGNWIKFPVSRNTEYEISTQDCTITFAYLSECENIMENGICVLDTTDNYKEMNKEEFLHFIDTPYKIPEIARYAGINKSYLQSLFSRQMHCTITDYINRKRLEQAAFLLINSSLTITDIAFHTGYNSRQHFAATFEKYYGSGPRAYRQLHGKQLETTTGKERFSEKDGIWNSKPL